MAEVDRIKVKIFHLLNKTVSAGCSENEAMTAAALAGKLMDQYALTMSDIQIRDEKCVQEYVQSPSMSRDGIDRCMVSLARYCDIKIWFIKGQRIKKYVGRNRNGRPKYEFTEVSSSKYGVFGLEQDVALFKYLFKVILVSADNACNDFKKTENYLNAETYNGGMRGGRLSAYKSFREGFAEGVSWKLHNMKDEREQEVREMRRTGTDLVVVKMETVEAEFEKTGLRLRRHYRYGQGAGDYNAGIAGREAGKKVNLNRGVNGSGQGMIA